MGSEMCIRDRHFLERVGSAVRFECPDFHLAESLAAELCFAAERLLRDKRVRPRRSCVDLVVDKVMQFEHVHDSDRDRHIEGSPRLAVSQHALPGLAELSPREKFEDLILVRAVEDRRGDMDTARRLIRQPQKIPVLETINKAGHPVAGVAGLEQFPHRGVIITHSEIDQLLAEKESELMEV